MPAPALVQLEDVGRLEPVRVGVRFAETAAQGSDAGALRLADAPLAAGTTRAGPFALQIDFERAPGAATGRVVLRNASLTPLRLDALVLGLRWVTPPFPLLRFLQHGWQSWSYTGARDLDEAGTPQFPSGPWLRGLHHALPEPPADRSGWHESHLVGVVGIPPDGPACLAGVLEAGQSFGLVYLRRGEGGIAVELELRLERILEPGESYEPEPVRLALGRDANVLLEEFADDLGRRAGARTHAPFQAGWCTWYHFFHRIDEETFLRNLDALVRHRDELGVEVVQLDDGYQRAVGDWLETCSSFPSGLAALAGAIREAGFVPGLWTAPFCVVPESRLMQAHPEWLLRHGEELHRGLIHEVWAREGWVFVLDPSRPEVRAHLRDTFAALADMGFTYQKLDFLYAAAMQAEASDPSLSRAARLRRGLEAIREGAGAEAFLLGCGCPLGPALGLVDGMRIGPDVAPSWDIAGAPRIPGIEETQPSTRNAVRNVMARAWMHRRLWLNDPDCLMTRTRDTQLTTAERDTLAAVIAASGGMTIFSDDVPALSPSSRERVRESVAWARRVDAASRHGTARAHELLAPELPSGLHAREAAGVLVALVNADDAPLTRCFEVPGSHGPPEPLLGSARPAVADGRLEVALAPHASSLVRLPALATLGVFCDFDGTFAVQDVGATLVRRHAGDRRPALWARLERGELTAWEYNLELLDGLELPEAKLEEFLRSVELSPGAHELVSWCEAHAVPFRVLSDGFDYNLDRLQELHGIRFDYDANHLRYEGEVWRIAAAHPDPSCSCGTGTCKRQRIDEFRARHPQARVVHIGNGRVSDLCAALAADVVLAKDSLAEELTRRGVRFEPFATLRDALPVLERLLDPS